MPGILHKVERSEAEITRDQASASIAAFRKCATHLLPQPRVQPPASENADRLRQAAEETGLLPDLRLIAAHPNLPNLKPSEVVWATIAAILFGTPEQEHAWLTRRFREDKPDRRDINDFLWYGVRNHRLMVDAILSLMKKPSRQAPQIAGDFRGYANLLASFIPNPDDRATLLLSAADSAKTSKDHLLCIAILLAHPSNTPQDGQLRSVVNAYILGVGKKATLKLCREVFGEAALVFMKN